MTHNEVCGSLCRGRDGSHPSSHEGLCVRGSSMEAVVDPGWAHPSAPKSGRVCLPGGGQRGHSLLHGPMAQPPWHRPQPPTPLCRPRWPLCPPQEGLELQDFNARFCLISHAGNTPKQAAHAALLTIKRKDHIIAVINH